jgi:hypothetical protein
MTPFDLVAMSLSRTWSYIAPAYSQLLHQEPGSYWTVIRTTKHPRTKIVNASHTRCVRIDCWEPCGGVWFAARCSRYFDPSAPEDSPILCLKPGTGVNVRIRRCLVSYARPIVIAAFPSPRHWPCRGRRPIIRLHCKRSEPGQIDEWEQFATRVAFTHVCIRYWNYPAAKAIYSP